MAAQIFSILQRFRQSRDWTQQEIAEFYRVESALLQAGLELETDRGLSDEGDPWFAFCRSDNSEVFIHFARIDGKYIAVGAALDRVIDGFDFSSLVREMVASQAWTMSRTRKHSNIFLHPAALLIALVGTAFFHSSEAKAAETGDHARMELRRHPLPFLIRGEGDSAAPALSGRETTTILSSVLIGLNSVAPTTPPLPRTDAGTAASRTSPTLAPPPPPQDPAGAPSLTSHAVTPQAPDSAHSTAALPAMAPIVFPNSAPTQVAVTPVVADHHTSAGATFGVAAPAPLDLAVTPSSINIVAFAQLSSYEAAQIIQSSGVLPQHDVQFSSEVYAPFLAQLIGSGGHVHLSPSPLSGLQSGSTGTEPLVSQPAITAPPNEGTTNLVASSSPGGTALPSVLPAPTLSDPAVSAAVSLFVSEVHTLDVLITGHGIILYDDAILGVLPAGTTLGSMTFSFPDGSSISLVGTSSELHNIHF